MTKENLIFGSVAQCHAASNGQAERTMSAKVESRKTESRCGSAMRAGFSSGAVLTKENLIFGSVAQ